MAAARSNARPPSSPRLRPIQDLGEGQQLLLGIETCREAPKPCVLLLFEPFLTGFELIFEAQTPRRVGQDHRHAAEGHDLVEPQGARAVAGRGQCEVALAQELREPRKPMRSTVSCVYIL